MMAQQIYVITSEGGPTKIGRSQRPSHRRTTLQYQFKDRQLSVAHVASVDGLKASAVEKKVHELLHEVRVHGEWFDIDTEHAILAINTAIQEVRDAGIVDVTPTSTVHWHLRITLDSSLKERIEEFARSERRSAANYIGLLIEKDMREKDAVQQ